MTTYEKLDMVQNLLLEIADETNDRANRIKEIDKPLYRMLTEQGSYLLLETHKGFITSGQFSTLKTRLYIVDKLLNKLEND